MTRIAASVYTRLPKFMLGINIRRLTKSILDTHTLLAKVQLREKHRHA